MAKMSFPQMYYTEKEENFLYFHYLATINNEETYV